MVFHAKLQAVQEKGEEHVRILKVKIMRTPVEKPMTGSPIDGRQRKHWRACTRDKEAVETGLAMNIQ